MQRLVWYVVNSVAGVLWTLAPPARTTYENQDGNSNNNSKNNPDDQTHRWRWRLLFWLNTIRTQLGHVLTTSPTWIAWGTTQVTIFAIGSALFKEGTVWTESETDRVYLQDLSPVVSYTSHLIPTTTHLELALVYPWRISSIAVQKDIRKAVQASLPWGGVPKKSWVDIKIIPEIVWIVVNTTVGEISKLRVGGV